MSGPEKLIEETGDHRGVTCAKCEHLNPHGQTACEYCGAHLHLLCSHCGHRNPRVRTRCSQCHHRLHRSLSSRLLRPLFGRNRKVPMTEIILLLLVVLLGWRLIVFLAEFSLPGM